MRLFPIYGDGRDNPPRPDRAEGSHDDLSQESPSGPIPQPESDPIVADSDETWTWRHADGSIRVDHMDARLGDYFGGPQ